MWTRGTGKNTSGCREKWTAWGASLALHGVLFFVLAFFGVFSLLKPVYENPQTLEVTLYDADAVAEAGGEDAPVASGGSAAADVPTIVLPSEAALPEIHEDFTKSPAKQEEYRKQHQQKHVDSSVSKSDSSAENGEGNGTANAGNGENETGNGKGQGKGNNSGSGTGNNAGTGRDAALAQRLKTPPQLLQGKNPRYPQDLEDEGIGGSVLLSLLVGSDGSVQSVSVAESSGYTEFDKAAVEAGYAYRFAPARNVYDEPVACRISKRMVFQP